MIKILYFRIVLEIKEMLKKISLNKKLSEILGLVFFSLYVISGALLSIIHWNNSVKEQLQSIQAVSIYSCTLTISNLWLIFFLTVTIILFICLFRNHKWINIIVSVFMILLVMITGFINYNRNDISFEDKGITYTKYSIEEGYLKGDTGLNISCDFTSDVSKVFAIESYSAGYSYMSICWLIGFILLMAGRRNQN